MWLIALLALLGGAYLLSGEARASTTRALPKSGEGGPDHGRTAKCDEGGWLEKVGSVFSTVVTSAIRVVANIPTGGAFDSQIHGALDEMSGKTRAMGAGQFSKWINQASNEEVVLLALADLRYQLKRRTNGSGDAKKILANIGVGQLELETNPLGAIEAAFRLTTAEMGVIAYIRPCTLLHRLQAIALLAYGGKGVLEVLDARLKVAPKTPKPASGDYAARRAWLDQTIKVLTVYRDSQLKQP
jgi:hypothetical protein